MRRLKEGELEITKNNRGKSGLEDSLKKRIDVENAKIYLAGTVIMTNAHCGSKSTVP